MINRRNRFDSTIIENAFKDILVKGRVTDTIYHSRPKSAPQKNDFAIVHVTGSIRDLATFGTCMVAVDLYTKDLSNKSNRTRLSYMYNRLIDVLPHVFSYEDKSFDGQSYDNDSFSNNKKKFEIIIDGYPSIMGDSPDDYGFTARLINVNVIIKVV